MGGRNSNLVDSLLDEETATQAAGETAESKSIVVKGSKIQYYRGFCNVAVAEEDLDKFHAFVGRDNYNTFSVSVPLDPSTNIKGVEFTVSLDSNGYPIGFNERLHNEASYKAAIAAMSARRNA